VRNFISPSSHPASFLTGSTLDSMLNKTKNLNTGYYVCTDNGMLTSSFKAYNAAKKKGLKPIIGCELYFVDRECDITRNTKSEKIKYYTITLHAKNQKAYQYLVKKVSEDNRPVIKILDQEYPTFNWKDLEEFSNEDFTAVLGGPQDIVTKNYLVGENGVAVRVFNKLKNIFGSNLYASIIPISFDKKWVTSSVFTFTDGQTVTLDSSILAETDYAKTFRVTLEEVASKIGKHKYIKKIYVNGIGYNVNKDIISACNNNNFKPINVDIYKKYNDLMIVLANRFEVPMILNDYSYYSDNEDKLAQNLKLGEEVRIAPDHSIKTTEEVKDYFEKNYDLRFLENLIDNSYKWASAFDDFELKYDYQLVQDHENPLAATMEIVKRVGRFDANDPVQRKILKHEIDVIHNNGVLDFLPYFFPIEKVLNYYTERGKLVGPARGSAGGSFLMYCMGITQCDPIKYGLYFSRFLTLGRIKKGTQPDVDVDLPSRDLLVAPDGFLNTYYKGKWSQLSTRTLMKLKSSVRDVNRFVKGKVEDEIEEFAKNLPPTPMGVSDQEFVFGYEDQDGNHIDGLIDKDEKLKTYTEARPEEWAIVSKTLGITRQNGRHACGFVISDKLISETIPTMSVAGVENVTQYEPKEVEDAGLLKYDFLTVKCLNDQELCLKLINEKFNNNTGSIGEPDTGHFWHKGDQLYIWDLPEESEIFDMLGEGKTETVFQLHTTSVTPYVVAMAPRSVEDIAVVTSLVRPGPLEFIDEKTGRNMAQEYIERRHGRSKGEIGVLDELLPETFGVMVFQEQITRMTKELTGWDDEKAEDVRIAVGKKKMKMIEELKPQFIEASAKIGRTDAQTAAIIWGMIEKFGRYGFNKSHAVAYSMIAYACAYLKHHYPLEWWTAVLSNAPEKEITEVFWPYVRDILSPPDINLSKEEMVIDYKTRTIRNKLSILRGLGEKVANRITENRPYKDIYDFISKKPVGPAMTRKLIHVGVLDSLFEGDLNLMEKMQLFENAIEENIYRKKIHDKAPDIEQNQPIEQFIEMAKIHPKTKRCKHEIKEGQIDSKYIFMNPIKDFILKKSIFPTMPMKLHDIIVEGCNNVRIINTESASYAIDPHAREVRILSGSGYQTFKDIPVQIDSKQTINFCLAGYVVEAKEFKYQNGNKSALKIILDVDGYLEEFVQWPDYDTGELIYPEKLKKNSVIFLFMYRRMGKEKYHTNIGNIVVEDILT